MSAKGENADMSLLASRLVLGTVQWGMPYGVANRTGQPDAGEVGQILELAAAHGVTTLDTARAYGASENVIGALTARDTRWTIVTKLSDALDDQASTPACVRAAQESLSLSRAALKRTKLDTVLLHRAAHRRISGGAVWDLLRRERDAGRIGQLGVSALSPEEAWEALDDGDVNAVQVASSLIDQRLSRAGFFERALAAKRAVYVRSIFLQGAALMNESALPQHLEPLQTALRLARGWAHTHSLPLVSAFLAFGFALPGARIIIGCERRAQLQENIDAIKSMDSKLESIRTCAASIPEFPESIVNPALWPRNQAVARQEGR